MLTKVGIITFIANGSNRFPFSGSTNIVTAGCGRIL